MSNPKKIKFYTQRGKFLDLEIKNKSWVTKIFFKIFQGVFNFFYAVGLAVIGFFVWLGNLITGVFFGSGRLIAKAFKKIYSSAKNDILSTKKFWVKRSKRIFTLPFAKSLGVFLIIALVASVGFSLLGFGAKLLAIKAQVLKSANLGNTYMAQAQDAITSKNFDLASDRFSLALKSFNQSQDEFKKTGVLINQALSLIPQKNQADKLLEAASLIASSGENLISLQTSVKNLNIGPAGISSPDRPAADVFKDIDNNLTQALDKLTRAQKLVSQVNPNILPASNRQTFSDLQDKLQTLQFSLNNFYKVFSLAKNILSGNKNILILFENSNELRATGGFMGTFGALKIKDGQISKINVSSIYDMDGQLTDVIKPPSPILSVNDRWYLRDSNWFASFPASAKVISYFYEKEGGETPDVIIAMTPNLIVDLLKITGPIALPKYNVTLNSENFVEQTQAISTISDYMPTNSPKQILADFVPVFIQKMASGDKDQGLSILQAIANNLTNKQIVFFAKDQALQNQLVGFHWTGELLDTDRDYLSVVSSNLGATKTDLGVEQKINLVSSIAADGNITNELNITRTNTLPNLPGSNNRSFLRIYAPLGSKLISNTGFDNPPDDKAIPIPLNYKLNEDVLTWEKYSVKDVLTGTLIGQETDKTFFGNWLEVKSGESKTIKLVYQLPFKVTNLDHYSLLLQKQIGSLDHSFSWTLNYPVRKAIWKNFQPTSTNTNSINSDIILNKDYLLGLVLRK